MAFVPAPNIMMVEIRMTNAGQQIENRIMCNNQGPVDEASLQAIATAVWDWWELTAAPLIPDEVLLREVVATDLTTQNGDQYVYAPDTTTTGEITGNVQPNEVSLCMSLRSDSRGRSARGRLFWPAISQNSMIDANNVSTTFANSFIAAGLSLIGICQEIAPLTIVSYVSNKAPRPGGPVYFPVTNATLVDRVVDSQRRRKPGNGT